MLSSLAEVVAKFLADESVKSRLLAEQQWMEGRPAYTWARAIETARFIRRLDAGTKHWILDVMMSWLSSSDNSLGSSDVDDAIVYMTCFNVFAKKVI